MAHNATLRYWRIKTQMLIKPSLKLSHLIRTTGPTYKTLKRTREIRQQLEGTCGKVGIELDAPDQIHIDEEKIQKALFSGFFPNIARLSELGNNYMLLKRKQPVYIHPSSGLGRVKPPSKLDIYHELVLTSKEYMRNCMRVEEKWVDEVAKHYYGEQAMEELHPKQ
ncbi:DUF1605-domain-containing protein [Metschnikowia bicuspidata var. bicuspidata NRRL YB-4993]|uniref:DUF1605-domain-containing protein n=1 Tax=Metschnikowia bicuspidata var. bicuspidata NRRL YB-4993 TaxID=869754 RepID=A0A1A0HJ08_9ASCO|nr:DUF1605-domain-containing protein [Metschnikowia bicuspidata var. bicuspidata NRRL YB-4993]OBA23986.1 DUF1605-domain-containing protein [Metschnikowia bicuspidata var. bicuspidata NRRL YB-4993]